MQTPAETRRETKTRAEERGESELEDERREARRSAEKEEATSAEEKGKGVEMHIVFLFLVYYYECCTSSPSSRQPRPAKRARSGRPRLALVKRRHKRQQAPPRRLHLARPGAPAQVPLAVAGKGQELHRLAVGHQRRKKAPLLANQPRLSRTASVCWVEGGKKKGGGGVKLEVHCLSSVHQQHCLSRIHQQYARASILAVGCAPSLFSLSRSIHQQYSHIHQHSVVHCGCLLAHPSAVGGARS
jgi:hypothetical protein